MWAQFFGTGLVETLDDLGAQAPACSHPELLDWLATEFVRFGWSRKQLVRLFVTSATYRQAASARDDKRRIDPQNRLLARAGRLRLPAEVVRDNALAAGGLLKLDLGGPSEAARGASAGAGGYRRSIYLRWTRQTLDELLVNFDAPTRDVACARRTPTNTPLQALTLLNDQAFMAAARGLADRARRSGANFDGQLDAAYRITVARRPEPAERRALAGLYERRRSALAADPAAAAGLLGETSGDLEPAALAERAAWVLVANALLNTSEFITRE
jgi:hypothetical protein